MAQKNSPVFLPIRQDEDTLQWRMRNLTSPIYVAKNSKLIVYAGSDTTGVNFRLMVIFQYPSGEVAKLVFPVVASGLPLGTVQPYEFDNLPEGFILSASCSKPYVGYATFVSCRISYDYSLIGIDNQDFVFLQGTITTWSGITFPGPSAVREMGDYQGRIRTIVGTDPAAGQEISETVPNGVRWEIISLRFQFVTDAAVANRVVRLIADNGVSIFWLISANYTQTAGIGNNYSWVPGFITANNLSDTVTAIPLKIILAAGYRLRTATTNIQAGDNHGAPVLVVREWVTQ